MSLLEPVCLLLILTFVSFSLSLANNLLTVFTRQSPDCVTDMCGIPRVTSAWQLIHMLSCNLQGWWWTSSSSRPKGEGTCTNAAHFHTGCQWCKHWVSSLLTCICINLCCCWPAILWPSAAKYDCNMSMSCHQAQCDPQLLYLQVKDAWDMWLTYVFPNNRLHSLP